MKKILSLGLLAITLFGVAACSTGTKVAASTIAIDVNPSIVLELDENDVVINIIKNNDDADIIIGDMNLIGVDYNVAINALIGSMVSNGYISDIANSILLSVQNDNETREQELMDALAQAIDETLTSSNIEGSIITQDLEFSDDAEELALELGISEAKAELILDIIEVDPRMVVEELAELSINDLNLLLESKNITLENVEKTGSASEEGLITGSEAYQTALLELSIDETLVVEYEVELEQEDGVMVYEIEVKTDTEEYEILINAKDGTVYVEVEDDDEDDDEDEAFPENALTEEEVLQVVVTQLNLDSTLITELEVEQEYENGISYYEVEFDYNDVEYELEVDALTGEIYTNSMDEEGFNHHDEDDEEDEIDDEDEKDDEDELDHEDDDDEDDDNENIDANQDPTNENEEADGTTSSTVNP